MLACDNCGAPLAVTDETRRLVTCRHCGTSRHIERADATALELQIARLDREWKEERKKYFVSNRAPTQELVDDSRKSARWGWVVVASTAVGVVALGVAMADFPPTSVLLLVLASVVMLGLALTAVVVNRRRAEAAARKLRDYQAARRAYEARRTALLGGTPLDTPSRPGKRKKAAAQ